MSGPPTLDNFEYREVLGAGGFSAVYLYEQLRPRRSVAVKVMNAEGLTESGLEQFEVEADVMAALSAHPSIVTIYSSGIADDGRPFLVMEYYPGPNLRVRALQDPLPVPEVLRVGIQVAAAIETAHRAGILHRDIKPANVLMSRYGRAGLTDFGISARGNDASETTGVSIPWAPPEAFSASGILDTRSDIYSLGATLYTLLTGAGPFERDNPPTTDAGRIERIRREAVPVTGRPDVPPTLERLLALCMAKSPELRPSSALEFARAMQELEMEMQLQPTPIDVLDEVARAAHDLVPSALRGLGGMPAVVAAAAADPELTSRNTSPRPPVDPDAPDEATVLRPKKVEATGPTGEASVPVAAVAAAASAPGSGATGPTPPPVASASASSARPNRLPVVLGAVAAAVLIIGGLAFALTRGGGSSDAGATDVATPAPPASSAPAAPSTAPTPEATAESSPEPTAAAVAAVTHSVRVDPVVRGGTTVLFDDTLDFSLTMCVARPAGVTQKRFTTFVNSARLYTGKPGDWTFMPGKPTIETPGDCTTKGATQILFSRTAATPGEASIDAGWSKPLQYRIHLADPTSIPESRRIKVDSDYLVSTQAESAS